MMMNKDLANLFLIGAGKSGTSTLHDYLSLHSEISGSKVKEPHYFCLNEKNRDITEYLKLFDSNTVYRLDSSTGYLVFDSALKSIVENVKDPKFLVILRNPIDRLISHYSWLYGYGDEHLTFWDALEVDGDSLPVYSFQKGGRGYKNYIGCGMYGLQIKSAIKMVGKDRLKVVFFEDFIENKEAVLKDIFLFLEIDSDSYDFSREIHTNQSINIKHKYIFSFIGSLKFGFFRVLIPLKVKKILRKIKNNLLIIIKNNKTNDKLFINELDRKKIVEIYKKDVDVLSRELNITDLPWLDFR